jgi:hypothetical protein
MAADPAGTLPDAAAPPVAADPATAPPTVAPAATAPINRPPAAAGPVAETRPGTAAGPRAPARPPAEAAAETGAGSSYSVLDEEPASDTDGRDAGEALADKFRSSQGSRPSGGFGASGRFRARQRSPRDLTPTERPAVATIRHLIDREEAFHRKEGRYATLADLGRSGPFLDVPTQALAFQRRGYKFELTVERDGFRIVAEPMAPGPRSFVGDDSGFIRAGVD